MDNQKFGANYELLKHGLYRLYWNDGGVSLASVGSDFYGNRWYAPTNWISGASLDWTRVKRAEPVLLNEWLDDEFSNN